MHDRRKTANSRCFMSFQRGMENKFYYKVHRENPGYIYFSLYELYRAFA